MAISVSPDERQGFAAYRIDNGAIELVVVPELGGKIAGVRDLRTGRDWLWTSPTLPYARHPYGTSYVQRADTGGWDECFPSVAACTHRGTDIPDHGEVWSQAWPTEIEERENGSVVVRSTATGVAWPYTFRRIITLPDDGNAALHLDYEVTNEGTDPLEFIWSAHPLFRIEPGMRVRLPDEARLHVYSDQGPTKLAQAQRWPPITEAGSALDPLPGPHAGVACKVWTDPLDSGWAELVTPDGSETFRFEFDTAGVPQVGVWINVGGWSGTGQDPYYNLALEPCIGAQDSLQEAAELYQQVRTVEPGVSSSWQLGVKLMTSEP